MAQSPSSELRVYWRSYNSKTWHPTSVETLASWLRISNKTAKFTFYPRTPIKAASMRWSGLFADYMLVFYER